MLLILALSIAFAGGALAQVTEPASQLQSTRTTAYERDPLTGVVTAEVLEPDTPQHCLRKEFVRDSFGNITRTTVRNCTGVGALGTSVIATRESSTTYGAAGEAAAGLYPSARTNAAGHVERLQHHNAIGLITRSEDPNGLGTTFSYDSLGRKLKAVLPDGNQTHWRYDHCDGITPGSGTINLPVDPGPCPKGAAYRVSEVPTSAAGTVNGAARVSFFDGQGRELQRQQLQFAAAGAAPQWSVISTEYDLMNRVYSRTDAYFASGLPTYTRYSYDALGRLVSESKSSSFEQDYPAVWYYEHSGRTTVATNPLRSRQTREFDEYERVIRVTDTLGAQHSYQYSAWGALHQTRDALGNTTQIFYDQSGNKARMSDPGMGVWTYQHDPLGQLRSQTSPRNHTTTYAYDNLGRLTARTDPDHISTFRYDSTSAGVACAEGTTSLGMLCEARAANGYERLNRYNAFGRIVRSATRVAASGPAYVSKIVYDSDGRIARQTWPTGLAVDSLYDPASGALTELRLAPGGQALWKRLGANARGQNTQVWHGNGAITANIYERHSGLLLRSRTGPIGAPADLIDQAYDYNVLGHLTAREDRRHGTYEIFSYDRLNRLTGTLLNNTVSAKLLRNVTHQYDVLGNMVYHSEVGVYRYASGPGSRPHALQSIDGQAGKLSNPSYSYDAAGNITAVAGANGVQRSHTWTSFDMPESLRLSQDDVQVSFLYGPERQRIREVSRRSFNGTPSQRTLNILHPDNEGALYFEREQIDSGAGAGNVENRHYISADGSAFLLITDTTAPIQAEPEPTLLAQAQQRYWHKDHLGSIVASSDASLGVIERLAYDPFGKRRHIDGSLDASGSIEASSTNRGFTGHEHLDSLDFVHMNARVYDPDIGRFLSADPTVPEFFNPQAYNRYAYAINNPLNLVDRNGFAPTTTGPSSGDSRSPDDSTPTRQGDSTASSGQLSKGEAAGAGPVSSPSEAPTLGIVGAVQVAQLTVPVGPPPLVNTPRNPHQTYPQDTNPYGLNPVPAHQLPSLPSLTTEDLDRGLRITSPGFGALMDALKGAFNLTTNQNAQGLGKVGGDTDAAKPTGATSASPPPDGDEGDSNKGNLKSVSDKKLKNDGIDAHDMKNDIVGKKRSGSYNISVDSVTGEVHLTPVRKGTASPVSTGLRYSELSKTYPLK